MKISPEELVEKNKDKTYEELLEVRDQLVAKLQRFEKDTEIDSEDVITYPLEDGNYYCNMKLLAGLCNLIAEKYGE